MLIDVADEAGLFIYLGAFTYQVSNSFSLRCFLLLLLLLLVLPLLLLHRLAHRHPPNLNEIAKSRR